MNNLMRLGEDIKVQLQNIQAAEDYFFPELVKRPILPPELRAKGLVTWLRYSRVSHTRP